MCFSKRNQSNHSRIHLKMFDSKTTSDVGTEWGLQIWLCAGVGWHPHSHLAGGRAKQGHWQWTKSPVQTKLPGCFSMPFAHIWHFSDKKIKSRFIHARPESLDSFSVHVFWSVAQWCALAWCCCFEICIDLSCIGTDDSGWLYSGIAFSTFCIFGSASVLMTILGFLANIFWISLIAHTGANSLVTLPAFFVCNLLTFSTNVQVETGCYICVFLCNAHRIDRFLNIYQIICTGWYC